MEPANNRRHYKPSRKGKFVEVNKEKQDGREIIPLSIFEEDPTWVMAAFIRANKNPLRLRRLKTY